MARKTGKFEQADTGTVFLDEIGDLTLLQDRPENSMILAQHFLRDESQTLKSGRISFSPGAMAALSAHDWPGNVRELQNCIRRTLSIFSGNTITPDELGLEQRKKYQRPCR